MPAGKSRSRKGSKKRRELLSSVSHSGSLCTGQLSPTSGSSFWCGYLPWIITLVSVLFNVFITTMSNPFFSAILEDTNSDAVDHRQVLTPRSGIDLMDLDLPPHFETAMTTVPIETNANSQKDTFHCDIPQTLKGKVYVYKLTEELRETPRKEWYEMFYREKYEESALNYGFGKPMYNGTESATFSSALHEDMYFTHMHALDVIFNERLKHDNAFLTEDPSEAELFVIPFAFGAHYRYWRTRNWTQLQATHSQLLSWLRHHSVYNEYIDKKPHLVLFGRIGYESLQISRKGSEFWNESLYYVASVDRNCHGATESCLRRVSMPHPSALHPSSVASLRRQLATARRLHASRTVLVSFCGALRTDVRKHLLDVCRSTIRWRKWKWYWPQPVDFSRHLPAPGYELCAFDDSLKIEEEMKRKGLRSHGERRRRLEIGFSLRCLNLYRKSVFCIQQGADSTTRKGLFDGMVAGCIPVFVHGVVANEFECFASATHPWYVVTHPEFYVKQLLALSPAYVALLRRNIQRLVPKMLYSKPNAGFHDAVDVLFACFVRQSPVLSIGDARNPKCTAEEMQRRKWFDFDQMLGYNQLYKQLGI